MLPALLALSAVTSLAYLITAIMTADNCFTKPCLSAELFKINPLKVDVSASVSAVILARYFVWNLKFACENLLLFLFI